MNKNKKQTVPAAKSDDEKAEAAENVETSVENVETTVETVENSETAEEKAPEEQPDTTDSEEGNE